MFSLDGNDVIPEQKKLRIGNTLNNYNYNYNLTSMNFFFQLLNIIIFISMKFLESCTIFYVEGIIFFKDIL